MTNIKDIAKLSGYSVSTVSRVLNQHPYVAAEKRAEILKIMQELDYVPNKKAQDLSFGKSYHIGVILPHANRPYFEKIINGVIGAAFNKGYKVTLLPTAHEKKVEKDYLEMLKTKAIDGLIITSKSHSFKEIEEYTKYGPIVCCEDTGNALLACVYIDRLSAYVHAFQILKNKGYQKVALTVGRPPEKSNSTKQMMAAYQQVFGELDKQLIFRNCTKIEDSYEAAHFFFNQDKKIEAILTNGDEIAAGIYQYLTKKQLAPVALIGQENLALSDILGFSTIDHHLCRIGEQAFELLMSEKIEKQLIPYTFIERF